MMRGSQLLEDKFSLEEALEGNKLGVCIQLKLRNVP